MNIRLAYMVLLCTVFMTSFLDGQFTFEIKKFADCTEQEINTLEQNIFNEVEFWTYTPGLAGYAQLVKFMDQQGFIASKKTVGNIIIDCCLAGFKSWDWIADFVMDHARRA